MDITQNPLYRLVEEYDRFSDYADAKIDRDIRDNRMGMFRLRFFDEAGAAFVPDSLSVKQVSHEFKFGGALFLLDEFADPERNAAYREAFRKIFNYGVAPLYWDTLEPVKGEPRFAKDSPRIWRRPALDRIREYCAENDIRLKGHCLVYNSFNPDWLPDSNRAIDVEIAKRIETLGEHCRYDFEDMDVINEMFTIYKNCYKGNGCRNLQVTDEPEHEKFCFELASRAFPCTRLFWNEGCYETFGRPQYNGTRSLYYLMLRRQLEMGTKIGGIGMQFHAWSPKENAEKHCGMLYNPVRAMDIFNCYSDFGLPIHISEISIPAWSTDPCDEEIQGELVRRMYRLWFAQKNVEATVWWNLVNGTAFGPKTGGENGFCAGLLHEDMTPKPAYRVLDELINHEWHTECELAPAERCVFNGFYGNYLVTFTHGGKKYEKKVRLFRDTTGYHNSLMDWRITEIRV